jgi:hypothetical protein
MSYRIEFNNRGPYFMSDTTGEALLRKQQSGQLSIRQQKSFEHVTSFTKVRRIDQHRIHMTKDMFDSECTECQKAAIEHRKTYWGEDE